MILTDFYEKFILVILALLINKPLLNIIKFPKSINKRIENKSICW